MNTYIVAVLYFNSLFAAEIWDGHVGETELLLMINLNQLEWSRLIFFLLTALRSKIWNGTNQQCAGHLRRLLSHFNIDDNLIHDKWQIVIIIRFLKNSKNCQTLPLFPVLEKCGLKCFQMQFDNQTSPFVSSILSTQLFMLGRWDASIEVFVFSLNGTESCLCEY